MRSLQINFLRLCFVFICLSAGGYARAQTIPTDSSIFPFEKLLTEKPVMLTDDTFAQPARQEKNKDANKVHADCLGPNEIFTACNTGNWNDINNWDNGFGCGTSGIPDGASVCAVIPSTITINTVASPNCLRLTIDAGGTFNNTNTATFSGAVDAFVCNGTWSGDQTVTLSGTGTSTLNGDNTSYPSTNTAGLNITNTLSVKTGSNLIFVKITLGTSGKTLTNSGTLELTGSGIDGAGNFTNAASKTLTLSGASGIISATGTITNNGTININGATGNITGTGTYTNAAGSTLNFKSGSTISKTTFTCAASTNTVNYNLDGSQTIVAPSSNYSNLTLSGTSATNIKTMAGALDINGDLTISGDAQLDVGSGLNYQINLAGNWVGTSNDADPFAERSGTVVFDGAGAQSIATAVAANVETFNNLTVDNAGGTLTMNDDVSVTTLLTMSSTSGTFDAGIFILSGAGGITATGGNLKIAEKSAADPAVIIPKLSGTYSLTGGTVTYSGAGLQTIRGGKTYFNIVVGVSGTKSINGDIVVNGNLTIQDAAILSADYFDGSLKQQTTTTYNITLAGNWSNTSSIADAFIESIGTVTLNGGAAQTITRTTGGTIETFNNLTISNASGDVTLSSGDVKIETTLNFTSGKIVLGANNLIIKSTGTITNYSSSLYVVTNGAGVFRRPAAAATPTDYPVGISTTQYNLVTLNSTDLSTFDVRVDNSVTTPRVAAQVVNAEWTINRTAGTGNTDVTLSWTSNTTAGASFDINGWVVMGVLGTEWTETDNSSIVTTSPFNVKVNAYPTANFNKPFAVGSGPYPLPIELLSFNGKYFSPSGEVSISRGKPRGEGHVELTWATASEINNDYFTIEKASDGIHFEALETIMGAGTSVFENHYS